MRKPPSTVVGCRVALRLVEESDAESILRWRLHPRSRHLPRIPDDAARQRRWIADYKRRERKGEEAYYVIAAGGKNCGATRLYDFSADSFAWGSLVVIDADPMVTLEAIALVYRIGFDCLGFARACFDVRRANRRVVELHRRLGARFIEERGDDVFFEFFPQDRAGLLSRLVPAAAPQK